MDNRRSQHTDTRRNDERRLPPNNSRRRSTSTGSAQQRSSNSANATRISNGALQRADVNKQVQGKSVKKQVSAGKAFGLGLLASLLVVILASVLLVGYSLLRTASTQSAYESTLNDAVNSVKDASSDVAFTPATDIRENIIGASARISAAPDAQSTDSDQSGSASADNVILDSSGEADASAANQTANDSNSQQSNMTSGSVYGSGVVVRSDGTIVASYHIVKGMKKITATINGTDYQADVVGEDPASDIAVLKVDAKNLTTAHIGQSASVTQGDFIMSASNAYNIGDTLSTGIISGLNRNFTCQLGQDSIMYADMMQLNLNGPWDDTCSGGGVYSASGDLIGIETMVKADEASGDKIGYAIPIDIAVPIIQGIITNGKAPHPSLGISVSDVPQDAIAKYGLQSGNGAYVQSVTPSGPSESAGIIKGDVITKINGNDVESAQDLLYKVRASKINDMTDLTVLREGKEMSMRVKIGSDV